MKIKHFEIWKQFILINFKIILSLKLNIPRTNRLKDSGDFSLKYVIF